MKLSLSPVYNFFAASDGFGEFCVIVSLAALITLAFMGRLTGSFAEALTAMNIGGITHDQMNQWQLRRLNREQQSNK